MATTPAARRLAARDYWNSPRAARIGRVFDRTLEALAAAAVILIGSLNF